MEKRILSQNLRRHVARLSVDIGERHLWNGDSLERAAQYIESEFSAAGYAPTRQTYTAYRRPVANIIVEKKGTRPQSIVIGAHYDSVLGIILAEEGLTEAEEELKQQLLTEKYGTDLWNLAGKYDTGGEEGRSPSDC